MDIPELRSWLRLKLTLGVGDENAHRLLKTFGLPEAIFDASPMALRQVVSEKRAAALKAEPPDLDAQLNALLAWLDSAPASNQTGNAERHVLTLADAHYPKSLLSLSDAPILLYATGAMPLSLLDNGRGLAVVGSRNPTPQGLANARQFARHFADLRLHVVSGLAMGIDASAHEGAMQSELAPYATVAVVGTGLDRVYPKQNHVLAHQITERGLILSEFEIGTPPVASNFPRRNRLIAALSQGCLVVEAALQSGSLITARLANEMGRDVFAIPGSIHSTQSRGCHLLIKQGAKLVESAEDVIGELRFTPNSTPQSTPETSVLSSHASHQSAEHPTLKALHGQNGASTPSLLQASVQESPLLAAIGHDPVSLDTLQARTGIDTASLQAQLFELELANQVARLPGGLVQRLVIV